MRRSPLYTHIVHPILAFEGQQQKAACSDDPPQNRKKARSGPLVRFSEDRVMSDQSIVTISDEREDSAPKSGLRRMLSVEQVLAIVPVSQVTLWRMERDGRFPRSTYISPNRRIWYEDEIVAWQREVDGRGRGRRHHPTGSKSTTT
jgi:predicted DNA-binding transcriptional regulator AlpA